MVQTLLVIDDSIDIHRLLDVRLRPEEVILYHALSADEGLQKVRELKPDLILLDVELPIRSGFEVCQTIKLDPALADIPVIFLTAATDIHTKVQGLELGAVDYVIKPFDPAELRARVRAALRTKRYHDLLSARANVDGLTGVWNRSYFNQRFGEEMAAAQRYGRLVSLVMLDLDHFKAHNDTFGHPFGDRVLQVVGDILHSAVRTTDAPCRFGGEEFAVVLTETPADGALVIADRIRLRIATTVFRPKDVNVPVTASFGIACSETLGSGDTVSVARMIQAADSALYRAKNEGRNRVCLATPPTDRSGSA
jgi:diguanylate cyclase (GGDEF)-like protein